MRDYIPDDAAMSHQPRENSLDRMERRQQRTMNRMHARKDELLDLLASPLPDIERHRLITELDDLRHDIGVLRYGATDYMWEEMRTKWR